MVVRSWWIPAALLAASACGNVSGKTVDASPARTDASRIDAPPDGIPIDAAVVDRSCTEVKARLSTSTDGYYWIDPDLDGTNYKPFYVWCGDMATTTPAEYLPLAMVSAPADDPSVSNYSAYATGAPHASWTCNCGMVTYLFSKVRIDPVTLIASSTPEFSVFANSTNQTCLSTMTGCPGLQPYGIAQACVTNYDAAGKANIDLRGIPFHVAGTGTDVSMFTGMGFTPAGTATIDATRKVVDLTGGGDCGGFGAYNGVQLAQDL